MAFVLCNQPRAFSIISGWWYRDFTSLRETSPELDENEWVGVEGVVCHLIEILRRCKQPSCVK